MPELLQGLIKANATVRVEKQTTARNSVGFLTETYTTITGAESVPVSCVVNGGSRDGRFDSQDDVLTGTIWAADEVFLQRGIRVYFLTGTIAGVYARCESLFDGGPGNELGLLTDQWHVINFTQVPA